MKTLCIIIGYVTGFCLFNIFVCGLWIKANHVNDAKTLGFHMAFGILAVIFSFISVILLITLAKKL